MFIIFFCDLQGGGICPSVVGIVLFQYMYMLLKHYVSSKNFPNVIFYYSATVGTILKLGGILRVHGIFFFIYSTQIDYPSVDDKQLSSNRFNQIINKV